MTAHSLPIISSKEAKSWADTLRQQARGQTFPDTFFDYTGWPSTRTARNLRLTSTGHKQFVVHYEGSRRALATFYCNYKDAKKKFDLYKIKAILLESRS